MRSKLIGFTIGETIVINCKLKTVGLINFQFSTFNFQFTKAVSRLAKAKFTYTFQRYEKKYYITAQQAEALLNKIGDRMIPDEYGETVICNLYYDTPDYLLIRRSLDKPLYKEKLRLRCYGVPNEDSVAFIEVKKKFAKVVYKRRLDTTYQKAVNYLKTGDINLSGQIKNELDWFLKSYKGLAPSTALFYTRKAFFDKTNPELRITIDKDIMWRRDDLNLILGKNLGVWNIQYLMM